MRRSVVKVAVTTLLTVALLSGMTIGAIAQQPPSDPLVTDPAGDQATGAPLEADILAVWFEHTIEDFFVRIHVSEPPPAGIPIRYEVHATPDHSAEPEGAEDCVMIAAEFETNGANRAPMEFTCGDYMEFGAEASVEALGDGTGVVTIEVRRSQSPMVDGNTLLRPHAASYSFVTNNNEPSSRALLDETADGRDYFIESVPGTCEYGQSAPPDPPLDPTPSVASRDANGCYPMSGAGDPALSADGRYLVFGSHSWNLFTPDANDRAELFLKDLETGELRLLTSPEDDVNRTHLSISADGRYVAYEEWSVGIGTPLSMRLERLDTTTGETERIDVDIPDNRGTAGFPIISAEGRHVAFGASSDGRYHVFVRDMDADTTTRASIPNSKIERLASAGSPSISADGRYVAFSANTRRSQDPAPALMIRDMQRRTTHLIKTSRLGRGAENPEISGDGRYVAYARRSSLTQRDGDELYDVYLYNVRKRTNRLVSTKPTKGEPQNGNYFGPRNIAVDHDGSIVLYGSATVPSQHDSEPPRSNAAFLFERRSGEVRAIVPKVRSGSTYSRVASLNISAEGSRVAFAYLPVADPMGRRTPQVYYLDLAQ
jgi:hypothetical protein